MNEIEEKIHRTWVQILIDCNFKELAAIAIDCELSTLTSGFDEYGLTIDIPSYSFGFINKNDKHKEILSKSLIKVSTGYIQDQNGNIIVDIEISYRIKLIDVETNWKSKVQELILNCTKVNQGLISNFSFDKAGKKLFSYNELNYASQSEIRIAQELENRNVLFFPLAVGVRAETGNNFEDHREVDFLVCDNGIWGILEVSYHPNRFEKDSEKNLWFKKSGILCIENFTAEKCYKTPNIVVDEFLNVLHKHKK